MIFFIFSSSFLTHYFSLPDAKRKPKDLTGYFCNSDLISLEYRFFHYLSTKRISIFFLKTGKIFLTFFEM